jgi:tRNA(Ile)-lysidine synthase
MDLLKKFLQFIQSENLIHPSDRLLVAVSGGLDSVSICELCKNAGFDFAIAHCNFRLRGEDSDRDELFVKSLAEKYQVPFFVKGFDTVGYAKSNRQSIEEAARDLRYNWFKELLDETANDFDYVLTAHHADDNIETVMMNFFRGTGITGLRGMLPRQGKIVRPLLFARRSDLETFVKDNNLPFVNDHTNQLTDYTRNFFRHSVIPLVAERYPQAENNVLRNIQRFKETAMLYEHAVEQMKKKLLETHGNEIHIPVLKLRKTVPLATVLYEVIKDYGFTAHQADEAIGLLNSESGKYIQSPSHYLLRNRNWLILSPRETREAANIIIEEKDALVTFERGSLALQRIAIEETQVGKNEHVAMLDAKNIRFPLLLRKWKQGDYFYPLGMQKKKKLSRFFIDNKLSLTQKQHAWVIEMDQKILWVIGMRIDDRFKITPATSKVLSITLSELAGDQIDHPGKKVRM